MATTLFSEGSSEYKRATKAMADPGFCIPADGIKCPGCAWHEGVQSSDRQTHLPQLNHQLLLCIVIWLRHRYCTGTCYNGECEGLHEEADVRKQEAAWKMPDRARLIIAAGKYPQCFKWL